MKINIKTRELFTDDDVLLKKMSCPKSESWKNMAEGKYLDQRTCKQCDREVTNISLLCDNDVATILKKNPDACLCIDLINTRMRVIP